MGYRHLDFDDLLFGSIPLEQRDTKGWKQGKRKQGIGRDTRQKRIGLER